MIFSSKLRDEILKTIKPSLKEHCIIEEKVTGFISTLEKNASQLNLDVSFYVGGSFGKGTYLKGNFDVDLFCRFNSKKYEDDKISFLLQSLLDTCNIKFKTLKGSRNYFEVLLDNKSNPIVVECVPTLDFNNPDDAKNSTDVSHLHVDFVKQKSELNPTLQDEIRLAKQFFKSKNLYGAESYIEGFSGHVIDLLIIHFGSLEGLISSGKTWSSRQFIDLTKKFKSESEALNILDSDKHSSLIIIDPILSIRNAARALSSDNYFRFILECYHIKSLEVEDFIIKKVNIEKSVKDEKRFSKRTNCKFVGYNITFSLENTTPDLVGAKLKRLYLRYLRDIKSFDFTVLKHVFYIDIENLQLFFGYHIQEHTLPSLKKVQGPPVEKSQAVLNFISDKSKYFVENSRVYSYLPREIKSPNQIPELTYERINAMNSTDMTFIVSIKKILF